MKIFLKVLIFVASTSIIMFGAWYMTKDPKIDPTLKSVLQIKAVANQTKDLLNETGVKSAADVTFKLEDDNIIFHYGKHKFKIKQSQVSTPEFIGYLKKLKLKIEKTDNGAYIIRYDGTIIEEIVQ